MIGWLRGRTLPVRMLAYVVAAASVFAVSVGLGAVGALMLWGDLASTGPEKPQPLQENTRRSHPDEELTTSAAAERREKPAASVAAGDQGEAGYTSKVGDIQAESVEAFLDSHERLLRYDGLAAGDVEKMRANQLILQESTGRVDGLGPPEDLEEHHEAFRTAVNQMHEGARLAYFLAADPTSATRAGFDEYDGHVSVAADRLQRSNEILGQKFETITGVREVSPL